MGCAGQAVAIRSRSRDSSSRGCRGRYPVYRSNAVRLLGYIAVCLPQINWVRHLAKPLVPFDNPLTSGQLPGPQISDHVVIMHADHRLAVAHVFGQKCYRHTIHQALRGVVVTTTVQRAEHPRYRIAAQSEMIQHVRKYAGKFSRQQSVRWPGK